MKTIRMYPVAPFVFLGMNFATAQTTGIDFGIKAGVNYGALPSCLRELSDKAGKRGFNIGAFSRLGSTLYLQPEVNYSTFGGQYEFSSESYEPKFKQVNVPIMAGYKLVNTESMSSRVSLGI